MDKKTTSHFGSGTVLAVCLKADPGIPKIPVDSIQLLKKLGVEGDYHAGKYVRHRYLAKKDPQQLNVRHVLLIDNLILGRLSDQGINLLPGELGENIILNGIDLMSLDLGTKLKIGQALLEISEIRHPCHQLNYAHPDVLESVIIKTAEGEVYRAGMFARILIGGEITSGAQVVISE